METKKLFVSIRVFANSVDPLIPELWAHESLAVLEENMVIGGLVHRDFSNVVQSYGDVVNTRRPGSFETNRKGTNDDVTLQDVTSTNVAVPLNQHAEVSFMIRDVEQSWAFQDLAAIYLREAVLSLVRHIDITLLSQYAQFYTNFMGSPSSISTSNAHEKILDVRNKMNINLAYPNGRNFIWAPNSETAVLKNPNFLLATNTGDGGTALRNASVGHKLGFEHFMGQNTPSIGSVTTNTGNSVGAINNASGYAVGTTALTVDGFVGDVVPDNCFIMIGSDCYRVVSSTVSTNTVAITIASPGLRNAVANDAVIKVITKGTTAAAYSAGYSKKLSVNHPTIGFQVGQMVALGDSPSADVYTVIASDTVNNTILLDRPLDSSVGSGANIYPSGAGEYNFAFHRNAMTFVNRPLAPAPVGTRSAVVNANNLSIRVTISYNPTKQGTQITLDILYGVKVLDVNLGAVYIN